MVLEVISDITRNLIPVALVIALIIFARLAIKAKTLRSLQWELFVFAIIWIIAELLRALLVLGVIQASGTLQLIGFVIHTISMVAFGVFILFRYRRYSLKREKDHDRG